MAVRAPVQLTLLVIGDDRSLVETSLDHGLDGPVSATVRAVPDVTAATGAFGVEPPDCVVVATGSVENDVETVLERLRALDADRPVVLLVDDEAAARAGMAAGATDYVLRTVAEAQPALLSARIRRAVDESTETGLPGAPAWYDALLEHSVDALTVLEADGTIAYQNSSVERLLGYDPEALVGTDALEYVHPEDRESVRATFERLYEAGEGTSEDLTFRLRHADGSWEWLESVTTARLDPGIGGYVVKSRLITERKEREREVERYETLLSVIPDTIAITDLEGTHVDIYGFEGWSGYEREELLGEHVSVTTPEEDLERAEEVVTDLIIDDDHRKATFETHIETKDGELIPFENHVTPLPPDEDGRIPGTMNVLRDVSERKEREHVLEMIETVFTNVQDGVFLIDVTDAGQFELQRANPAFRTGTGWVDEAIHGKTPRELAGPDIGAEIEARLQQCVDQRAPIEYDDSFEVNGEVRHFHNRMAPVIEDGDVVGIVGVGRDVTVRVERQRELELKNQAMDEAPIGITIAEETPDGPALTYVNDGFEEMTGYDEADVLGDDWSILHGEETDREATAPLREGIERAEAASSEVLIYCSDGVPCWCQVNISPIRSEGGDVTHFVGFQQDITDLKEYETEIERRFDEFADVLAEDLRDPLASARSAVDTARENGDENALEEAAEWIERADSLIADLATIHSFSVPSRDHSESALLGSYDDE